MYACNNSNYIQELDQTTTAHSPYLIIAMSKLGLFSSCGMKCGGRWSIPRKWHYICLVWYTHMIHKHSYFCGLAIEASDHRVTVSKYFLYKLGELGGAGPISKGLPQPLHILCTYVPGWAISCRTQQWQQKIHCRAPVLASFSPIGQSTSSSLLSHFCMSRESSDVQAITQQHEFIIDLTLRSPI